MNDAPIFNAYYNKKVTVIKTDREQVTGTLLDVSDNFIELFVDDKVVSLNKSVVAEIHSPS